MVRGGKSKGPTVPPSRTETVRREIIAALRGRELSARDISAEVGLPERQVAGHLEHIRRSLGLSGAVFFMAPAECLKCGFVFKKRQRLTRPGRCPKCRSSHIREPLFSVKR